MTESPLDVDGLGVEDLKRLVLELLEEIAALKTDNAALREGMARLKGLKGPDNRLIPQNYPRFSAPMHFLV